MLCKLYLAIIPIVKIQKISVSIVRKYPMNNEKVDVRKYFLANSYKVIGFKHVLFIKPS